MDTESVQNEEPSYGGDTSQVAIMNSRPQNTEEGVRVDCPGTVRVLEKTSVDISPEAKPREDRKMMFNNLTICESEQSIVYSGTDSRNSDIAAMSDFSDDEDGTQVEFRPGIPTGSVRDDSIKEESSLCDRPITNTVTAGDGQDSLDPNDTEYWNHFRRLTKQAFLLNDDSLADSKYPDAVKEVVRRSRLTIMALNEYDAPPFEQRTDDGTPGCSDSEDTSSQCMSTDDDSDDDFFQYNDWHNGMNTVMPGQTAEDTNRTVRNGNNNCAQYSAPENGNDTKSDVNLGPVGRAKSKFTTTEAGIEIYSLGVDYAKCDDIPVTKMIPVGVLDTDEHLVMRVSTITAEVSGLETSSHSNDAMNDSPGIQECACPERRRRDELSAHVDIQLLVDNNQRSMTVCCFGLCGITDRLSRPELDWCWDCVDRLVWGYCVSCVVTIVTKTRSLGIDLFTEGRCVYASTLGLVDVHVRAYDVIPVYVWMKENFKGGLNGVGSGMVRGRSGTVRSAAVVVLGHPCWLRVNP